MQKETFNWRGMKMLAYGDFSLGPDGTDFKIDHAYFICQENDKNRAAVSQEIIDEINEDPKEFIEQILDEKKAEKEYAQCEDGMEEYYNKRYGDFA